MGSYNFSIDGHTMDVIEADGQDTERHTVDMLRIGVGQRCNFAITKPKILFWLNANHFVLLITFGYEQI
jgi:iron transport multicopper oxidase